MHQQGRKGLELRMSHRLNTELECEGCCKKETVIYRAQEVFFPVCSVQVRSQLANSGTALFLKNDVH